MMEVRTMGYLPRHITDIEEFKRICFSYDEELRLLWEALNVQLINLNLSTMDEATCSRWAALLDVSFMPDNNLEDKRRTIRGKMASGLPYTERKIREVISSMVGEEYYVWDLDRTGKRLKVGILLAECNNVNAVAKVVRDMIPADVDASVYIYFNRWVRFRGMTWGALYPTGTETWGDIKQNTKWQEE